MSLIKHLQFKQSWTVELEMEYFDNTPPCTGQPDYDWCNTPKGMVGFRPKFVGGKIKILKLL